ncbi:phosphatase PAP2 family protein [Aureimonas sp. SK2]|uniref:phosphatase PAP2 family protein n=1 Tax=Aureimonas sp. SK2 TaxID=3015992 RepID=UPI00387E7915
MGFRSLRSGKRRLSPVARSDTPRAARPQPCAADRDRRRSHHGAARPQPRCDDIRRSPAPSDRRPQHPRDLSGRAARNRAPPQEHDRPRAPAGCSGFRWPGSLHNRLAVLGCLPPQLLFSSGEAASAAVLPMLALLVPRRWRAAVVLLLAVLAAAFSVNRIAFGSHFLSDVLVSWVLVALSAMTVWRCLASRAARIDMTLDGCLQRPFARTRRALSSSFAIGALLRAPDGTLGSLSPERHRRRSPLRARSSSIREHSEAWLFRATSRRSFSPIPAASTPRSS